jgi:phosphatidylserine/phosphatidylglycerophosphate/cardiolipin synthase-like enzyme
MANQLPVFYYGNHGRMNGILVGQSISRGSPMSHSLIILPEDSNAEILDAISQAKGTLSIKMFIFKDLSLLGEVIKAHTRGVRVRVMLNPQRRDGKKENDETRAALTAAGIEVKDSNPAFDLTHEKSMVVDDRIAFVQSFNWESEAFLASRDYAIITSRESEVADILACFDADWNRTTFVSREPALIWCVGNGRQRLGEFIDRTKHSLWIQNERFQDPAIIEHLVRACSRGVRLHVIARSLHKLKKEKLAEAASGLRILQDVGAKVHTLKHVKVHGKLLFADECRAIVGSINLAPGSFDSRRELAIETTKGHLMQQIHDILRSDWTMSKPMDLSDQGLLEELKKCDPEVREDLGLAHP